MLKVSIIMACNGVLTLPSKNTPQIGTPSVLKFFYPPPVLKLITTPSDWKQKTWRCEANVIWMAVSKFFTHYYFQQAHIHISEAIIND